MSPTGTARRLGLLSTFLFSPLSHADLVGHWVAADLPAGLVSAWNDRISGIPAINDGDPEKLASGGVHFDGNDALVVASDANPAANDNTVTLTVAFVVTSGASIFNPYDPGVWWNNSLLVGRELPGWDRGDWGLGITSQNQAIAGRGEPDSGVLGGAALNDGGIHVATAVFNGDSESVSLFIDGAKIGEQPGAGISNIEEQTLNFGVNILGNFDTAYFTGEILEIRIDDEVLADPDVLNLHGNLLSGHQGGPDISLFTASPDDIYEGRTSTLEWSVTGVDGELGVGIDQGAPAISGAAGSIEVSPLADTTYTFTATDATGSNTAAILVKVDPGIPTAAPQSVSTPQDVAKEITLGGADPNLHPNAALEFAVTSGPSNGSLTGTPPDLIYTPDNGFFGSDSFVFETRDGKYNSPPATVDIAVLSAPAPPTAIQLSTTNISEGVPGGGLVAILASVDPNSGDTHDYSLVAGSGDLDNAAFAIVGNQLRAAAAFAGTVGNALSIRLRTVDGAGFSFEQSFTLQVIEVNQGVVINEIHYNPPLNTLRQEFIELHNPTEMTIDLSGWRLTGAVDFVFPAATSVPAGGYLVIAEDPATLAGTLGADALGPYLGKLSSDGEVVRLLDANDNPIDEVDYRVGFPWPVAADGGGASIELIHPSLDNSKGSSWRASQPRNSLSAQILLPFEDSAWTWRPGGSEASDPVESWRSPDFIEDGSWTSGARTPIGYGFIDGLTLNTVISGMQFNYHCVFLRNRFEVAAGEIPSQLLLRHTADDGIVVWINGHEVERRRFNAGEPPTIDDTANGFGTEGAFEQTVVLDPGAFLVEGTNTIAVQLFNTNIDSSDLAFDIEIGRPGPDDVLAVPSPGERNLIFADNAAPNISKVAHFPEQPVSSDPVIVTAVVTDPDGVSSVVLEYQTVAPGAYIPSRLPLPIIGNDIDTNSDRPDNPAYETGWTSVAMSDDGVGGDAFTGDDVFSATLPAAAHRTLLRYRITIEDALGESIRVPYPDDPSLNFAYFVYNGIPAYQGTSAATMADTLPVYHLLTRNGDYDDCIAYDGSKQIFQGSEARFLYNWNGTLVYDGKVHDNVRYRLRGANGRYQGGGKRSMRVRLNDGSHLQARDQQGRKYDQLWRTLTLGKGASNHSTMTFGLNEAVNFYLFGKLGVPAANPLHIHWRVIDDASEAPDKWRGDFQGTLFVSETYDVRFLEEHDLEKGNLYKLINQTSDWEKQQRYQSAFAPADGSDHNTIEQQLNGSRSATYVRDHVNLDKWYAWQALSQATRHYDFWPDANKNMVYYFEPDYTAGNDNKGRLWILPWDTDSSWGPSWNSGHDVVYNAVFPSDDGNSNPELWPDYHNAIREVRDLLWQEDQIGPVIDEFAGHLSPIIAADFERWRSAPADAGNYNSLGGPGVSSLAAYVQDMKNFAFTGGSWPGGNGASMSEANDSGLSGRQGRDAFLDFLQGSNGEGSRIPDTPVISYTGAASHPTNALSFHSSDFADPQGDGGFGAMEWRIAEITDPAAPVHDPADRFKLEIESSWESGELPVFTADISIPTSAVRSGLTYRARVRHKDATGRWSHWSAPAEFTTTLPDVADHLAGLVITELMYRPADPSPAEIDAGFDDNGFFEYIELKNVGPTVLDLRDLRFTKGIDFDFLGGAVTSLPPGGLVLVVNHLAAFETRYGGGLPVAGAWQAGDKLNNGGEQVKLSFGAGDPIRDFTYDNSSPWPAGADEGGIPLILLNPAAIPVPNHALPANWAAGSVVGGTPGSDEPVAGYAAWRDGLFGPGNPPDSGELDDADLDGIVNLLEYAFGTDPLDPESVPQPTVGIHRADLDYPTITYTRRIESPDLSFTVQVAGELSVWNSGPTFTAPVGEAFDNGDGTETLTERSLIPIPGTLQQFLRIAVESR